MTFQLMNGKNEEANITERSCNDVQIFWHDHLHYMRRVTRMVSCQYYRLAPLQHRSMKFNFDVSEKMYSAHIEHGLAKKA
jgi:hypothetical protein